MLYNFNYIHSMCTFSKRQNYKDSKKISDYRGWLGEGRRTKQAEHRDYFGSDNTLCDTIMTTR